MSKYVGKVTLKVLYERGKSGTLLFNLNLRLER